MCGTKPKCYCNRKYLEDAGFSFSIALIARKCRSREKNCEKKVSKEDYEKLKKDGKVRDNSKKNIVVKGIRGRGRGRVLEKEEVEEKKEWKHVNWFKKKNGGYHQFISNFGNSKYIKNVHYKKKNGKFERTHEEVEKIN
jgi:hypothetical protein